MNYYFQRARYVINQFKSAASNNNNNNNIKIMISNNSEMQIRGNFGVFQRFSAYFGHWVYFGLSSNWVWVTVDQTEPTELWGLLIYGEYLISMKHFLLCR